LFYVINILHWLIIYTPRISIILFSIAYNTRYFNSHEDFSLLKYVLQYWYYAKMSHFSLLSIFSAVDFLFACLFFLHCATNSFSMFCFTYHFLRKVALDELWFYKLRCLRKESPPNLAKILSANFPVYYQKAVLSSKDLKKWEFCD
jgi:hypothetical protein